MQQRGEYSRALARAQLIYHVCLGAAILAGLAGLAGQSEWTVAVSAAVGAFAALLACGSKLPEHVDSDDYIDGADTVLRVLKSDPELTIFRTCIEDLQENVHNAGLQGCAGLMLLDDNDDGVTVFAPTDTAMIAPAFKDLAKKLRKSGPEAREAWATMILSHICETTILPEDLEEADHVRRVPVLCSVARSSNLRAHVLTLQVVSVNSQHIIIRRLRHMSHNNKLSGASGELKRKWKWPHRKAKDGIVYKIDCILTPGHLTKQQDEID